MPATVQFAGLTPGFIGLGQLNVLVPGRRAGGRRRAGVDPIGRPNEQDCDGVGPVKALSLLLCVSAAAAADRYQVTLRLPPGGLYAREEMQIELRVEDTTRPDPLGGFAPVIRAAPEATIDMPEMPKMPKFVETAHAERRARRVRHPSDLRARRRIPAPASPSILPTASLSRRSFR